MSPYLVKGAVPLFYIIKRPCYPIIAEKAGVVKFTNDN